MCLPQETGSHNSGPSSDEMTAWVPIIHNYSLLASLQESLWTQYCRLSIFTTCHYFKNQLSHVITMGLTLRYPIVESFDMFRQPPGEFRTCAASAGQRGKGCCQAWQLDCKHSDLCSKYIHCTSFEHILYHSISTFKKQVLKYSKTSTNSSSLVSEQLSS